MSCPKTSIFSVFKKLMLSSIPCWNEAEQQSMEKNKDWLDVENFHFSPLSVKVSVIEQQRVTNCWYSSFFSQQIAGTGKAAMNKDHGLVYRWLLYDLLSVYKSHLFRHVIEIIPLITYQVFHLPVWPIGEEKRRRDVCYQSLLPRDL